MLIAFVISALPALIFFKKLFFHEFTVVQLKLCVPYFEVNFLITKRVQKAFAYIPTFCLMLWDCLLEATKYVNIEVAKMKF